MLVPTTILPLLSIVSSRFVPSPSRDTVTASRIVCSADPRKEIWYTAVWETKRSLLYPSSHASYSFFPFSSVARRTAVFLRVFRRWQECKVTWRRRGERASFPPANPPFPKLSSDHVRSGIFPWTRKFVGWHDSRVFQPRMCTRDPRGRVERTVYCFGRGRIRLERVYTQGKISIVCVERKIEYLGWGKCV